MIDASRYAIDDNRKITKEVIDYAHKFDVTVEAEVGHISGSEDDVIASCSNNATIDDCLKLVEGIDLDFLAPALGSVHGIYKGEPDLDFITMENISNQLKMPLVLHGGSGISDRDIKKAISCGICKININTELQLVWHEAVCNFIKKYPEVYDPRKVISSGEKAIKNIVIKKVYLLQNI